MAVGLRQRRAPRTTEGEGADAELQSERESPKWAARSQDAPAGVGERYTVGVGDTLATVAMRHHTSPEQLKKMNRLLTPNLYSGQLLRVPRRSPVRSEEVEPDSDDALCE